MGHMLWHYFLFQTEHWTFVGIYKDDQQHWVEHGPSKEVQAQTFDDGEGAESKEGRLLNCFLFPGEKLFLLME